jgi:hypothetical protein
MADDLVTLALPPGIDGYPISHGDRSFPYYRPDPNGPFLVDVPAEVAEHLLLRGGFSRMVRKEDAVASPGGFAMIRGPAGHSGFSFGGQSYRPDANGVVTIPVGAVEVARSHGFDDPAEAEILEARTAELAAKDAEIADLKAKLAAVPNSAKREQTKDRGYRLPESGAGKPAKTTAV